MKKKTIGIFAHVDSGKTSFSEQLLYHTGAIRNLGRVDHKNTVLDAHALERQRGITIFADQAYFIYEDTIYYLIDTPGHIDFSAEAERTVSSLDYAVLIVSGKEGVQAHTTSLFKLLARYNIPLFIFINKIDMEDFSLEKTIKDIKRKLSQDILFISTNPLNDDFMEQDNICEFLADRNEELMGLYLEDKLKKDSIKPHLIEAIKSRNCFPVLAGSALKNIGILEFLKVFHILTETIYHEHTEDPFTGRVYKIRYDNKGNRITFIKALKGTIKPKDEFYFGEQGEAEKINEIRLYTGEKYESISEASAGDIFAVTGLKTAASGDFLGEEKSIGSYYFDTALESKVSFSSEIDRNYVFDSLKILEAEEPTLSVKYEKEVDSITIHVMGKIQLEILKEIIKERFNLDVEFQEPEVLYRETIGKAVIGYGHYEPLRHYAEVNLRLEPQERGTGISFDSECHVDKLPLNYQNLIEKHVFEKAHKGILTGFPITDMKIVLVNGRAHLKHTEGGDFREATYRAIRQGLEKADKILLEPYYSFHIYAPIDYMGRILSDIQRLAGTFEIEDGSNEILHIQGRGPVSTFMEYSSELLAITKGRGSITLLFDGYDICHNREEVIEKIAYDKGADKENTSASVFCSKGAGFLVTWEEAEKYMHCIEK